MKLQNELITTFPAFQNKNYRLYFFGQLISLIGTWLHIVAQSWLVLKLTHSAFLIGLIAALSTTPTFLFTLFCGVMVDRFSKKKILLYTQVSAMLLALILGILTVKNVITVWEIGVIAFILGTINAIDSPARQAFMSEIVSKEQLSSAIALNSSVFNAARVIGPGVAGIVIAIFGTGGAFIFNGVSYMAVILALLLMKVHYVTPVIILKPIEAIKEGLNYTINHPLIGPILLLTGVTSIFGWSYSTVMPLIAHNDFHVEATGLGYMYAAAGFGSLIGAIFIGTHANKISSVIFIFGGNTLFALSIFTFTYSQNIYMSLPFLFLSGLGLLSQFAMMNTIIQNVVKPEYLGRVMSIYIFMFVGLTPFGNFIIGFLSEKMGTDFAIRFCALIVLVFGIIIFLYMKKKDQNYSFNEINRNSNLSQ